MTKLCRPGHSIGMVAFCRRAVTLSQSGMLLEMVSILAMMTTTTRMIYGRKAWKLEPPPPKEAPPAAKPLAGPVAGGPPAGASRLSPSSSGSSSKRQAVRGCQTRKRPTRAARQTRAERTSTRIGPRKFAVMNWVTAKEMPAVSTAGITCVIPRQPAITKIMNPGMMIEKSGSCRPIIAERALVTASVSPPVMGATSPPKVVTGTPKDPNATGAVFASRAMEAA